MVITMINSEEVATREEADVDHSGFAFYGVAATRATLVKGYHWALEWFERLGTVPDFGDADIRGKTNGKYKSFKSVHRSLHKSEFEGIGHWTLLSVPEDKKQFKYPMSRGRLLECSYDIRFAYSTLVFTLETATYRKQESDFNNMALEACKLFQPYAGIGYNCRKGNIPILFGAGYGGAKNDDDLGNLTHWRMLLEKGCYKYLRNVFRWNFLGEEVLSRVIEGLRLDAWARKNGFGQFEPITDILTLWKLTDAELPEVRSRLLEARVILDRKRDCESVLKEYRCTDDEMIEFLISGKEPPCRTPKGIPATETEAALAKLGGTLIKVERNK